VRDAGRTGTVVEIDQRDDLALLAVPGLRARRPRIAAAATETAVTLVLCNGRVLRLPARVIRSVTARIRTPDGEQMVQRPALVLRAEVQSGDSGAPVLTSDGRIAGVIFARDSRAPRVGYAVDAGVLTRWSAPAQPR
jgi:S1-C subfamily serine protease